MTDGIRDDGFLPRLNLRPEQFAPIPICWPSPFGDERDARFQELADWTA
jgi:hypothetical protein